LRGLAITGTKRSPAFPDIPTLTEAGVPGQEHDLIIGLLAPGGTPRPVIDRLNREIVAALQAPATKARLNELGLEAIGGTPEQATRLVESEIQRWSAVIKAANIKFEQ
jgi:tripartite-type tricarboxylate transporter receptor subunit TctC